MEITFCPNCGHQNQPGSRFCEECGCDLIQAARAQQAQQEAQMTQQMQQQKQAQAKQQVQAQQEAQAQQRVQAAKQNMAAQTSFNTAKAKEKSSWINSWNNNPSDFHWHCCYSNSYWCN